MAHDLVVVGPVRWARRGRIGGTALSGLLWTRGSHRPISSPSAGTRAQAPPPGRCATPCAPTGVGLTRKTGVCPDKRLLAARVGCWSARRRRPRSPEIRSRRQRGPIIPPCPSDSFLPAWPVKRALTSPASTGTTTASIRRQQPHSPLAHSEVEATSSSPKGSSASIPATERMSSTTATLCR